MSAVKSRAKNVAGDALVAAKKRASGTVTWIELHNSLFGMGGVCVKLFPTPEARTAFSKTMEYAEIMKLLDAAPDEDGVKHSEASGKLLIRVPKSLHAALIKEAEIEETSVNQLIVAKLSAQLRAVVS